jgi:hypothetical protein
MNEQLRLVGDEHIAEPVASPIATALCGTCEQCGKSFTPRAGSGGKHQRFCSSECRQRWHTANPNVAQRGGSHVGGDELTLAKPPLEENLTSGFPAGITAPHSDPDRFDWINDDSVVLAEQPATAIYRNREDSIVIRQQAAWDREEDSLVVITEQNVMAFLDQLCDLAGIAEFGGPKPGRS